MKSELIKWFKVLNSTSQKAKELSVENYEPWIVVVADEQVSGHGTKGKEWFSPAGGLYFSIVLPIADIKDLQIITILAAFAVAKTVKEEYGLEPMIKIPNDILINGKKFCGILTENIISGNVRSSIIGIGIDTNIPEFPEELKDIATSIKKEIKVEVDNKKLLEKIIKELEQYFKEITN